MKFLDIKGLTIEEESKRLDTLKSEDGTLQLSIDPTIYTRTFRVNRKTHIWHLRKYASEFWGFQDTRSILYVVEEDGTLRDLQFELQSAVTRVAESNHTAALRYVTEFRGKKRDIGQSKIIFTLYLRQKMI